MALSERVICTTTTTGTGNLTLSATGVRDNANGDYLAPAETLSGPCSLANRIVSYYITSGGRWARGKGVISANGLTLTRDNLEWSWNGSAFSQAMLNLTGVSTVIINGDMADVSSGSIGLSVPVARGIFSF